MPYQCAKPRRERVSPFRAMFRAMGGSSWGESVGTSGGADSADCNPTGGLRKGLKCLFLTLRHENAQALPGIPR